MLPLITSFMDQKDQRSIYDSNVRGTKNICLKVLEHKKYIVYTSSVATLGIETGKISDEETSVSFDDMEIIRSPNI